MLGVQGGVTAAAFDMDANLLVTGGYDGSLNIWSPEGHRLDSFPNLTNLITSIAYLPSTHTYWVCGKHRSLNLPTYLPTYKNVCCVLCLNMKPQHQTANPKTLKPKS